MWRREVRHITNKTQERLTAPRGACPLVSSMAQGGVAVEAVGKDVSALSAAERADAVLRDAPELLVLLGELRQCLAEVRSRVGPLLKEVRRITAQG